MSTRPTPPRDDAPELSMEPEDGAPLFEVRPGAGERRVPISEDFGEQLHVAQEELLHLRHKQEEVERRQAELEELRQKQERFLKGRVEIAERLEKSLTRLDRETFQTRKRMEILDHAKESFTRHLDRIEALRPERWAREDLRNELVKATAALEDADQDYHEAMVRLGLTGSAVATEAPEIAVPDGGLAVAPRGWPGFKYWLLVGGAVSLPIAVWILVLLLVHALVS